MKIEKFIYNGKERELFILRETDSFKEGIDLSYLGDEDKNYIREGISHFILEDGPKSGKLLVIDKRLIDKENNKDGFIDNFSNFMIGYRRFSNSKIEELK